MFGLTYLNLYINISFIRLFERTYDTYDNFHTIFSTYIHKFSNIVYKNNLYHIEK